VRASGPDVLDVVGPVVALVEVVAYLWSATGVAGRRWPRRRSIAWIIGSVTAAVAVSGPVADAADTSYTAHMLAHVLVGMAGPLLLVLGAPVTLLLRTLPRPAGRQLSRLLRWGPVRFLTEPVVAALLSVGGLWLLYTTRLYDVMHRDSLVHAVVHVHMFVAGYLFATSIVGVDPMRHRRRYAHRAGVLVIALAMHDILAKYLYSHPPVGVGQPSGQFGAIIMYYGGDTVDLAIAVLLCAAWYRAARPRAMGPPSRPWPPVVFVKPPTGLPLDEEPRCRQPVVRPPTSRRLVWPARSLRVRR